VRGNSKKEMVLCAGQILLERGERKKKRKKKKVKEEGSENQEK